MPVSPLFRPESHFPSSAKAFPIPCAPPSSRKRASASATTASPLGVGLDGLTDEEWIAAFARFEPLPGDARRPARPALPRPPVPHLQRRARRRPRLPLYAQLREAGTAGCSTSAPRAPGQTPCRACGDGRLTLKGGVREVLATEMLEALGAPTGQVASPVRDRRSLEPQRRAQPDRAASVLVRLSRSHIRFGTFQRHAFPTGPTRLARLCRPRDRGTITGACATRRGGTGPALLTAVRRALGRTGGAGWRPASCTACSTPTT